MWRDYVDNSGQMDPKLNRPLRHYPAHYYKRQIKQKIGLQRKEAKIQNILQKATIPQHKDDFTKLHPIHHTRILDAFERMEAWERVAKIRQTERNQKDASCQEEGEHEVDHAFSDIPPEMCTPTAVNSIESDDSAERKAPELFKDDVIPTIRNVDDFSLDNRGPDTLDDEIGIPDYGGIDFDGDEYYAEDFDEGAYMGYDGADDEMYDSADEEKNEL